MVSISSNNEQPSIQEGAPTTVLPTLVPRVEGYKDYKELSLDLGFPVMEAVDEQMLSLYEAMLRTFGRTFTVPRGKGAVGRTRNIVSKWGPQLQDSEQDIASFRESLAKAKFFKRYLSAEEYEGSAKLETSANAKYLKTMLEGHAYNESILANEALKPLLANMRHIVKLAMGEFDMYAIYKEMKHGPNSTGTIPRSDAYIDVKDWDLTGTRSSLQQMWHYLRWNNIRREELCCMSDAHRAFINAMDFTACNVVDTNDTLQVPKEWDTLRTMNPEHTVPAQFAQGTANVMEEALFRLGIDLSSQPEVHRNLAKIGSQFAEANIATIDWSEASNRIWIAIFEEVFEEDWVRWIKACCRTPYTGIKFSFTCLRKIDGKLLDKDEFGYSEFMTMMRNHDHLIDAGKLSYEQTLKTRTLKSGDTVERITVTVKILSPMVATMGNPLTFPLQTLIFYAFLASCSDIAALRISSDPQAAGLNDMFVSSFGDDGICSTRILDEVHLYAKHLGWIFNDHKSFSSGSFRESCGGDYYRGLEVRPVMLKRPPHTHGVFETTKEQKRVLQAWSYIAANAVEDLVRRSDKSTSLIQEWLVNFHEVFQLGMVCLVPPSYPDGSGLRVRLINYRPVIGPVEHEPYCLPETVENLSDKMRESAHLPHFDVFAKGYRFMSLGSEPLRRSPCEIHYYERAWLRFTDPKGHWRDGSLSKVACDVVVPRYHVFSRFTGCEARDLRPKGALIDKGFFDLSRLDRTVLDKDGKIPIKELRLQKCSTTVPQWEWWLTEAMNK